MNRHKLNIACRKNVKQGHADGTRTNHRSHHNSYIKFCDEYRFQPYPASNWRYCQYAQYLSNKNRKPGTIHNHISSIKTLHKLQNLKVPDDGQIHYKLITKSFEKQRLEPVKQATPISHKLMQKLFQQVDLTQELEAVAWTAVLVGFSAMLGVSNLGPRTRKLFDHTKHMIRSDLKFERDIWNITIRWSKTIQCRNRVVKAP